MMRHLTTLVLTAVLGTLVLAGNAEACHKSAALARHRWPVRRLWFAGGQHHPPGLWYAPSQS